MNEERQQKERQHQQQHQHHSNRTITKPRLLEASKWSATTDITRVKTTAPSKGKIKEDTAHGKP